MSFARNSERRYMILGMCLLTAIKYVGHRGLNLIPSWIFTEQNTNVVVI